MPCYSCSSEFGFLKKEVGCDMCGFSFCTRCCKKQELPFKQGDTAKKLVCNKCYAKLTSQVKMTSVSPPLAHKKRMAALKKQSFSVDSGTYASSFSSQWPNVKDKEIAERLQKLKRDRGKDVLPSEDDIAERLAKLKGIEPAKYKAPPIEVYRPPDRRTSIEQAAELLKQVKLEAELDSRLVKPEDEIAARLARLRDEPISEEKKDSEKSSPEIDLSKIQAGQQETEEMDIDQTHEHWLKEHASASKTASKDLFSLINDPDYQKLLLDMQKEKGKNRGTNEDENEEAEKLVEKLLAAPGFDEELDSFDDTEDSVSKSEKDTTEEFPWCVICSEDAKIRCLDCDSDVYCFRCFKECHENFDITDHRTCPYLPVKNSDI